VLPLGLLDRFKVGRPSGSCRRKKCRVKPVSLRGAEGRVISFPELGEKCRSPGFRPQHCLLYRGVKGQLGRDLV